MIISLLAICVANEVKPMIASMVAGAAFGGAVYRYFTGGRRVAAAVVEEPVAGAGDAVVEAPRGGAGDVVVEEPVAGAGDAVVQPQEVFIAQAVLANVTLNEILEDLSLDDSSREFQLGRAVVKLQQANPLKPFYLRLLKNFLTGHLDEAEQLRVSSHLLGRGFSQEQVERALGLLRAFDRCLQTIRARK